MPNIFNCDTSIKSLPCTRMYARCKDALKSKIKWSLLFVGFIGQHGTGTFNIEKIKFMVLGKCVAPILHLLIELC